MARKLLYTFRASLKGKLEHGLIHEPRYCLWPASSGAARQSVPRGTPVIA